MLSGRRTTLIAHILISVVWIIIILFCVYLLVFLHRIRPGFIHVLHIRTMLCVDMHLFLHLTFFKQPDIPITFMNCLCSSNTVLLSLVICTQKCSKLTRCSIGVLSATSLHRIGSLVITIDIVFVTEISMLKFSQVVLNLCMIRWRSISVSARETASSRYMFFLSCYLPILKPSPLALFIFWMRSTLRLSPCLMPACTSASSVKICFCFDTKIFC